MRITVALEAISVELSRYILIRRTLILELILSAWPRNPRHTNKLAQPSKKEM